MKGCDDNSANIQLYLDKELSGLDLEEFRVHLDKCADCKKDLGAEEELSRRLHRSRPLYSAPDALRARINLATAAPLPSTSPTTPIGLRRRISRIFVQPLQSTARRGRSWQALAAMVLIVAAGGLFVPQLLKQSRSASYVEAAVAAHRSFLDGSLPLEVQSDSPDEVTAWFTGKVPFTFRLPSSGETSGHKVIYKLTGGRLVTYNGGYAALVAYQMPQAKISLLVASSQSAMATGGQEVRSGGLVFHYRTQANFHIITWSNHGLTYALVSSLPGYGRQSCLVCHQSMADGDHFTAHR